MLTTDILLVVLFSLLTEHCGKERWLVQWWHCKRKVCDVFRLCVGFNSDEKLRESKSSTKVLLTSVEIFTYDSERLTHMAERI